MNPPPSLLPVPPEETIAVVRRWRADGRSDLIAYVPDRDRSGAFDLDHLPPEAPRWRSLGTFRITPDDVLHPESDAHTALERPRALDAIHRAYPEARTIPTHALGVVVTLPCPPALCALLDARDAMLRRFNAEIDAFQTAHGAPVVIRPEPTPSSDEELA